jgi:hypothetical protein
MPKRYYTFTISDRADIHVFFESGDGVILRFVVKLVLQVEDRFYEVVRFDSGHDCPHKDILDKNGDVARKIWYAFLDNKQALTVGIKDLKDNHALYIERFEKWLKE